MILVWLDNISTFHLFSIIRTVLTLFYAVLTFFSSHFNFKEVYFGGVLNILNILYHYNRLHFWMVYPTAASSHSPLFSQISPFFNILLTNGLAGLSLVVSSRVRSSQIQILCIVRRNLKKKLFYVFTLVQNNSWKKSL